MNQRQWLYRDGYSAPDVSTHSLTTLERDEGFDRIDQRVEGLWAHREAGATLDSGRAIDQPGRRESFAAWMRESSVDASLRRSASRSKTAASRRQDY